MTHGGRRPGSGRKHVDSVRIEAGGVLVEALRRLHLIR
jgi:hypothetical protein